MYATTYLPLIGTALLLIALITIEILAQSSGRWLGGIALPYISDTGAIPPGYYVFAIMGTLGAFLLLLQHAILSPRLRNLFDHAKAPNSAKLAWLIGCGLAALGIVAMIMLMVLSTYDYPSAHDYSAYAFFVLSAVSMLCYTISLGRLRSFQPAFATSFVAKLALLVVFSIAFIIYLPVGLAIVCEWKRLPYSSDYCQAHGSMCLKYPLLVNETACLDHPCTVFWDYSGCPSINTMRSSAQLICVICLILYQGTFVTDNLNVARHSDRTNSFDKPIANGA